MVMTSLLGETSLQASIHNASGNSAMSDCFLPNRDKSILSRGESDGSGRTDSNALLFGAGDGNVVVGVEAKDSRTNLITR